MIKNIIWGVMWGVLAALVCMSVALIRYVLQGEAPFLANGTTFVKLAKAYLAGGIGGGLVVGLLRPIARFEVGAFILGILTVFPMYVAISIAMVGPIQSWDGGDWFIAIIASLVAGIFTGNEFWKNQEHFLGPKSELWRLF